jgi:hypothetical protein
MSYWNYRVLEAEDGTLGIHEVYYDEHAQPEYCTVDPVDLGGWTSVMDLVGTIEYIQKAFLKPILNYEDF